MVEDIHKRRLSGSSRTPSVMVDAISEGMVLAVIAGTETGGNWWLREPMVMVESPGGGGPPDGAPPFFFLRLPNGQYGPVSQLSRSEKCCTGPFNWGEAHCAGEKVKRKIGPFQRKSL